MWQAGSDWPSEAEIVRLAFRLYLHGDGKSGPMGVKDVTSALNARGFTQRSGRPFRLQTVHLMLTRSAYMRPRARLRA